ncbi:MAG TPA: hypothetical protein VGM37_00495 [Armatimonadota bacterium]|jgi:Tol biopolymer transport system component
MAKVWVPIRFAALAAVFVAADAPPGAAQATARVSITSAGAQANWESRQPAISADGRFIAFVSGASNLVPGGAPDVDDVYLRDRLSGQTTCVSVATTGARGDADSDSPAISADGRFIAFRSYASNLVPGDANGVEDIFVHDVRLGTTVRVSTDSAGHEADSFSDAPAISADGAVVAFSSRASNLAANAPAGLRGIYAHVMKTGATALVTHAFDGAAANGDSFSPSLSADGRIVAYSSPASNIVLGDFNQESDVFLTDRLTGATSRVSVGGGGLEANSDSDSPALSGSGRAVAFRSFATNIAPGASGLGDIFLRDVSAGVTTLVSAGTSGLPANAASEAPAISADARFVAFQSLASNLVASDINGWEDVFLRDVRTGQTMLISAASAHGDYWSQAPAMTPDALYVAFTSYASNLDASDTNSVGDIYVRGPLSVPYSVVEAQRALLIAAGLDAASQFEMARLNIATAGASAAVVDVADAIRIARKAAGLDP